MTWVVVGQEREPLESGWWAVKPRPGWVPVLEWVPLRDPNLTEEQEER